LMAVMQRVNSITLNAGRLCLMGMSAEIIAIGPFSADIADALSYPAHYYANTRPGAVVITSLFSWMPGSSSSCDFARYLGISDPWDFNQHKIEPSGVDLAGLRSFLETLGNSEDSRDYGSEMLRFVRLRDRGFAFYFVPNG